MEGRRGVLGTERMALLIFPLGTLPMLMCLTPEFVQGKLTCWQ